MKTTITNPVQGREGHRSGQPDLNRRVGIAIRRLRQFSKLTQNELAESADTTQSLISMIENGKRNKYINLNTLRKIAIAVGEDNLASLIRFAESTSDSILDDILGKPETAAHVKREKSKGASKNRSSSRERVCA
ncbi:MAG: helix-turn-helix transcriptional regulator [bacterium]